MVFFFFLLVIPDGRDRIGKGRSKGHIRIPIPIPKSWEWGNDERDVDRSASVSAVIE
jgi:hypothetical protein